ncbi:hypothetical protein EIP86_005511, partial [Pleurotus ostreatoroseus]
MEKQKDVSNTERADGRLARGESAGLGVQMSSGPNAEGEAGEVSAVERAESMVPVAGTESVAVDDPARTT